MYVHMLIVDYLHAVPVEAYGDLAFECAVLQPSLQHLRAAPYDQASGSRQSHASQQALPLLHVQLNTSLASPPELQKSPYLRVLQPALQRPIATPQTSIDISTKTVPCACAAQREPHEAPAVLQRGPRVRVLQPALHRPRSLQVDRVHANCRGGLSGGAAQE